MYTCIAKNAFCSLFLVCEHEQCGYFLKSLIVVYTQKCLCADPATMLVKMGWRKTAEMPRDEGVVGVSGTWGMRGERRHRNGLEPDWEGLKGM